MITMENLVRAFGSMLICVALFFIVAYTIDYIKRKWWR